jgi:hypothetical protein
MLNLDTHILLRAVAGSLTPREVSAYQETDPDTAALPA